MPAKLLYTPCLMGVGTTKSVSFIGVTPYKWHKEHKFPVIEGLSIVN